MSANPLKARNQANDSKFAVLPVPRSREEWLDWCWERNQRAMQEGWRNWLFIRDVAGKIHVEAAAGDDASEIWMMLDDKPLVPYQWTDLNIRKYHGLLAWRIHRGMTADAYMLWAVEGRANRRKAYIEAQIAASGGSGQ